MEKGANAAHCPYLCWCINRPLRSLLETLNTLNVGLVAMPWLAPMAATPCPENEMEIVAETGLTRHWRALMTRSLAPRVGPDDIFFSYQTLLRDPR